jgi:hypothetical protein
MVKRLPDLYFRPINNALSKIVEKCQFIMVAVFKSAGNQSIHGHKDLHNLFFTSQSIGIISQVLINACKHYLLQEKMFQYERLHRTASTGQ